MRVLFITKPFKIEPLGIMYIIAALKKIGCSVQLITTDENYWRIARSTSPDFVMYSIMTGDEEFYNTINERVKSACTTFTIAGGPHPTFFPEMIHNSSFDAICVGEGEKAIVQFINNYSWGHNYDTKNFHFKEIQNPVQPLVSNLDDIDFPDREEVNRFAHIRNGPIKHFMASRGCPYDCSYCFNHAYGELYKGKGRRVRFRTVDNVLNEIWTTCISTETKLVYFQDDTFILDQDWLEEFCTKYKTEIGLPFHCHGRANVVDAKVASLLSYAGCRSVHMAVECGNEIVRNRVLNRNMTDKQIAEAMHWFKSYSIGVMLQNILGLPGTTLQDDFKTLEMNIALEPTYAWASIFQPYPKTQLGIYSEKIGEFDGDYSKIDSNFFDRSPLELPHADKLPQLQKLFAFAVQNPTVYDSGLLLDMLNADLDYAPLYKMLRDKADKELYGVKL
jgi:radical SAM superfamily enzyme YgiQ (UPF0313 family)